jgi:predicted MPP superfamily phosphohydrolase
MKIGILHLSDLHIQDEILTGRIVKLVKAVEFDVKQLSNLYIVLSGDVTNYGRKKEFENAKILVNYLTDKLKNIGGLLTIKIIAVPGNHDCCFDNEKKTRKSIINDCKTDIIEEEDYFVDAMAVQSNFWDFTNEMTEYKSRNDVSYKYEFRPHLDFKVSFHCYNTSWLTEIDEKQGSLIIPENKFIENENGEYVISVFHHPIDWLSANTNRNNKQRFEEHLINSSNLVIYGHEHDKGNSKKIIQKNNNLVFCGGKAFDINEINETGFSLYEIDLTDKSIKIKTFNFDGTIYTVEFEDKHKIVEKNKREFLMTCEFERKITELNIPLKHSKKTKLLLSDIFVYPDLEPLLEEDSVAQYTNSTELIEMVKNDEKINVFIEGADQAGKTALLYVYYKRYYEMGFTPIYLRGKYCNETNVKKLVKKALKEQYNNDNVDLFFQTERKILILDNFHKSKLNSRYKKRLIESFNDNFEFIFLTSDNSYSSQNVTEEATSLKDYLKFKLLPLGHEKRSELIEQWLLIGENKLTIQEEVLLTNVKLRFDEIDSLIGNRLMPSHPIFILTLLQSLDENLQNFSQTSYSNIYLVLIKAGLIKEGIKDSVLTSLLNILKELSFFMYNENKNPFNRSDFDKFIQSNFDAKFFRHKSLTNDKILNVLRNANILKFDDEYYSFSYKYIYYFLIAQKVSADIDNYENLIYTLCNNIHLEINANILIFLSHHSKAQILIDSIVLTSEVPFENASPLTLNKDDEFVKFIAEFTDVIKDKIIEERNPKEEVKNQLKLKDSIERQKLKEVKKNDDGILPPEAIEMNQAFRTVKIIGQIVKNQSGDFEKEKLIKLVEAAYNTVFRFLGFYSGMLEKDKELLIESIVEDIKEKEKKNKRGEVDALQIEKTVRKILQFISWRICVESMTNLMFAVGTKGQNELFDKVNVNIGSTASKIVTFAIKTFYDKIDLKELAGLFEDVKYNYLAQCILREYIKRYLYTNFVERNKRDQIIQIAGFNKQRLIGKMKSR